MKKSEKKKKDWRLIYNITYWKKTKSRSIIAIAQAQYFSLGILNIYFSLPIEVVLVLFKYQIIISLQLSTNKMCTQVMLLN